MSRAARAAGLCRGSSAGTGRTASSAQAPSPPRRSPAASATELA
jgi:hypothetical protein